VEGKVKPEVFVVGVLCFPVLWFMTNTKALDLYLMHTKVACVYFGAHINRLQYSRCP